MLTARILGYGGALPFLGGAIAASQQMVIWGLAPTYFLISYGAVILSFLGGLHWGRVITSPFEDEHYASRRSDPVWLYGLSARLCWAGWRCCCLLNLLLWFCHCVFCGFAD